MGQSSETKKFLNGFDYLLLPFVIAVGLVVLFKGMVSQVYFFSDLLTSKEINSRNDCYQDFSDFCKVWGNKEKYDYAYEFRLPILNFLFGDYRRTLNNIELGILLFEALLVAYVWFRVKKYIERKKKI